MDISNRFSLADFLAYFFPGIFTATGIYIILLLTPIGPKITDLFSDLNFGFLFLVFSYILGVITSSISEIFTNRLRHKNDTEIPLVGFEKDIELAFKVIFGQKDLKWTRYHFYLCRTIVTQYMPSESLIIQRQSSLRQLRMNLLPSIIIWTFDGIIWSYQIYIGLSKQLGGWLIVASLMIGIIVFFTTINRMQNNDQREIRETLAAFLSGFKTGLFKKSK